MPGQLTFRNDYEGASAGTKLFLQDGFWFYKTDTEEERFLSIKFVDEHSELFGFSTTVTEMKHHIKI